MVLCIHNFTVRDLDDPGGGAATFYCSSPMKKRKKWTLVEWFEDILELGSAIRLTLFCLVWMDLNLGFHI